LVNVNKSKDEDVIIADKTVPVEFQLKVKAMCI